MPAATGVRAIIEPDAERRAWLGAQLEHAAAALGVTATSTPVFGWHDRTIGARVSAADGERWLRVAAEMSYWAGGAFWTGNADARAISGVPKPRLLTELDWSDGDCLLRAELMTVAPSSVIANGMVLRISRVMAHSYRATSSGSSLGGWCLSRNATDSYNDHLP